MRSTLLLLLLVAVATVKAGRHHRAVTEDPKAEKKDIVPKDNAEKEGEVSVFISQRSRFQWMPLQDTEVGRRFPWNLPKVRFRTRLQQIFTS